MAEQKSSPENPLSLMDLPNEIWPEILKHFEYKNNGGSEDITIASVQPLMRTCKKLNASVADYAPVKKYFQDKLAEIADKKIFKPGRWDILTFFEQKRLCEQLKKQDQASPANNARAAIEVLSKYKKPFDPRLCCGISLLTWSLSLTGLGIGSLWSGAKHLERSLSAESERNKVVHEALGNAQQTMGAIILMVIAVIWLVHLVLTVANIRRMRQAVRALDSKPDNDDIEAQFAAKSPGAKKAD